MQISSRFKTIFTIQDEPPSWPSDSDDLGLESVSDVNEADLSFDEPADAFTLEDPPDGDENGDIDEHKRNASVGSSVPIDVIRKSASEEGETEDEFVDSLTPGAGTSPSGPYSQQPFNGAIDEEDADADLEWIESGMPVTTPQPNTYVQQQQQSSTQAQSDPSSIANGNGNANVSQAQSSQSATAVAPSQMSVSSAYSSNGPASQR